MSKLLKAYDRSRIPLYIQVASVLRRRIQSGQWDLGDKISTLEELEIEFEVARVTVRQAIDMLQEEGLLQAQQGRGTFVTKKAQDRHWLKLATNWISLINSLKDNVPRRISRDEDCSPPDLGLSDGKPARQYVRLRSVQYRNEEPYSVVDLHLAREIFDLDPKRFMSAAALPILDARDDIVLQAAYQTLVIGSADPRIADLMKIPLGAPTVECHYVVINDEGTAIYVGDIIYRSDCIKIHMDLLDAPPAPARRAPSHLGVEKTRARRS